MSKRKKDILSIKDNAAFLKAYQKDLQESYHIAHELCYPDDFIPVPEGEVPTTPPDSERVARLADDNGFDGSLFRDLTNNGDPTSLQSMKSLKKKIETIPRIIAKIEKAVETEHDETLEPTDLIDLAKALTYVQISRTQIKRDIYKGKIKSYRKDSKGKHFVSLSEIQKVYLTK